MKDNVISLTKFRQQADKIKQAKNSKSLEKSVSQFGAELDKQRRRLKKRNIKLTDDKGNVAILTTLLNMTLRLIDTAEKQFNVYKNERAAYALVALTNQVRECMNDIRIFRTGKKQHQHIVNQIMLPNMQLMLQHYLNDCSELKSLLNKTAKPDERKRIIAAIDMMMRNHATVFNQTSDKIQTTMADYLIG